MEDRSSRGTFLTSLAAAVTMPALALRPAFALGETTTQAALFATLPTPTTGDWTRIILGTGVPYQKQIGIGVDHGPDAAAFIETQVGSPGGSCNPNSMRKAYLVGRVGSIIEQYPVATYVALSGNLVYRDGDEDGNGVSKVTPPLRLLDAAYLYDDRPLTIVSRRPETLRLAGRELRTEHVVARYGAPRTAKDRLRTLELWSSPDVPFGFAKYRATAAGLDPFEAHVYSFGRDFKTELAAPLADVRAKTKDGQYMYLGLPSSPAAGNGI